jgi:hypothetical protein
MNGEATESTIGRAPATERQRLNLFQTFGEERTR